eukprot:jgi/Botrbrau1/21847/Bobra.0190s0061.2
MLLQQDMMAKINEKLCFFWGGGRGAAFCVNHKSSLLMVKRHISGTNLAGPYWNGVNYPPIRTIATGLKDYQKAIGGPPDVVVVSSNFWDLASWFANGHWSFEGMPSESQILSDEVLMQWTANMTKILTHLKVRAPKHTLLVYHTMHTPVPYPVPGYKVWESDRYVAQHVAQLNAAGRHVARSLGYHILDLEAMAAQMHRETLMADITHPQNWFVMEALNVLLNLDAAHRPAAYPADCDHSGHVTHMTVHSKFHRRAAGPIPAIEESRRGTQGTEEAWAEDDEEEEWWENRAFPAGGQPPEGLPSGADAVKNSGGEEQPPQNVPRVAIHLQRPTWEQDWGGEAPEEGPRFEPHVKHVAATKGGREGSLDGPPHGAAHVRHSRRQPQPLEKGAKAPQPSTRLHLVKRLLG